MGNIKRWGGGVGNIKEWAISKGEGGQYLGVG